MKKTARFLTITGVLALLLLMLCANGLEAQQRKRAQTSMKFLSTSNFANAAGMANAVTAVEGGAWTQFYNPAAIAWTTQNVDVTGSVTEFIADINYSAGAASFRPGKGNFGVVGVQFFGVDYGDFQRTIRTDGESGYADAGTFSPNAFSFGLSYAKALSNQFSVGANFKYVTQNLGAGIVDINQDQSFQEQTFEANATVIDFGVFYKTGFESLNFAMVLRNFSPDVRFDALDHELPLTFKMGLSMDVFDLTNIDRTKHSMLVSLDANRSRDFNEQIQIGGQYTFLDLFILRGGYVFPSDEEGFTAGFGVKGKLRRDQYVQVDYSYSDFGVFDNVSRLTFRITL